MTPAPALSDMNAEQALLGAILTFPDAFSAVAHMLTPDDFSDDWNADLWRRIAVKAEAGEDPTVQNMARTDDERRYLASLVANGPVVAFAPANARHIRRQSIGRRILARARGWQADLEADGAEIDLIADEMATLLDEVRDDGIRRRRAQHIGDVAVSVLERVGERVQAARAGEPVPAVRAGLAELDDLLGGLTGGQLIVIAGRPGMGKSGLAASIARNAARDGYGTLFVSLEMSDAEVTARWLAMESSIPAKTLERTDPKLYDIDLQRLEEARDVLAELPLHVDDVAGLTLAELRLRCLEHRRRHGLGLVIVDYLQLMAGVARAGNRTEEVSAITRGLKVLAKETDVPLIALSQLSRAVEGRDNKRPMLSDLRESGSIEQDADVVLFVFREAEYLRQSRPSRGDHKFDEWEADFEAVRDKAEIIVAKQRQGPTGTAHVAFNAQTTEFRDGG